MSAIINGKTGRNVQFQKALMILFAIPKTL